MNLDIETFDITVIRRIRRDNLNTILNSLYNHREYNCLCIFEKNLLTNTIDQLNLKLKEMQKAEEQEKAKPNELLSELDKN